MELVSCGRTFPGHEIAIVDPGGQPLGERQVGEVWLRGPSVAAGYFGDPDATAETFGGGWLHTGDLGYRAADDLFICGRVKDLIILNGKNYYPQDIEGIVSRVDGIRDGQCVAFSRLDPSGAESTVVLAESRKDTAGLAAAVVSAVRAEIGLQINHVYFIKRGTLPKTSSGKVRRLECKRRLEMGELELAFESDVDRPERTVHDGSSPALCVPGNSSLVRVKDSPQGAIDGIQ